MLTRMPGPLVVDPPAADAIRRLSPETCWLDGESAASLLTRCGPIGIVGGAVYDALVAEAAPVHGRRLLTRDERSRRTYDLIGVEYVTVGRPTRASPAPDCRRQPLVRRARVHEDGVVEPTFGPEDFERYRSGPPDQAQRLRRDQHGLGPHRRTRPWIAVAAGLLVIAAFVVIVASGGGENSPDPGGGVVVDSPP